MNANQLKNGVRIENCVFFNLTPHAINVHDGDAVTVFPPSGVIARCAVVQRESFKLAGVSVVKSEFGEIENLPDPDMWQEEIGSDAETVSAVFIVSGLVASRADRDDVVAPDTAGSGIRNEQGQIVGVRRFCR